MRKNLYLRCTIRGDGKGGKVELNGSDKEVLTMTTLILQNVAATLGIDIEKFCEFVSKVTIESSKDIAKRMEEKESNGNSAQSIDTMLSF